VFPVDLDWTNEAIVALGSRISNDSNENWDVPLKKYEDLLISWRQRSLSFRGHTLIVNTLGLSLFWYLATFESIPQSLIVKINGLTFPYIWGKKHEWLARTSVIQPTKDGGLGAVDVDKKIMSLHCLWIKRYLLGPRHGWHSFLEFFVRRAFPNKNSVLDVLLSKTLATRSLKLLPPFYKSVLLLWIKLLPTFDRNVWNIPTTPDVSIDLNQLTARVAYRLFKPPVIHRCFAKFASFGFNMNWSWVWRSLSLWK
jgi:hypothetical protein